MSEQTWHFLADIAKARGEHVDTVRRRVGRFKRGKSPAEVNGLVRTLDSGDDGGPARVQVSNELVATWRSPFAAKEPAPTVGPTRVEVDHLRAEVELATQTARHAEVAAHQAEIDKLKAEHKAEIASLRGKYDRVEAAYNELKSEHRNLLLSALERLDGERR